MKFKLSKCERALVKAKTIMETQYRIVLIGDGSDVAPYLYETNDKELGDNCILEFSESFIPGKYDGGYVLFCYYSNGEKERFVCSDITSILVKAREKINLLSRFRISAHMACLDHLESKVLLDWDISSINAEVKKHEP